MTDLLERVAQRLHVTGHRGEDQFYARCPAHDDHNASLVVSRGDNGGVLIKCHAMCDTQAVLDAAGLTWGDVTPAPHVVATYDYIGDNGELLYQVQRWEPKDFRCVPGLPSKAERRLYHGQWLAEARATGRTVYVAEGEKDCDNLARAGHIAVCGAGGAGSWLDHYAEQLRGCDVVVIADADDPGRQHARQVVRSLDGKAKAVALVEPSYGKDVSDQLAAGYGVDTLVPLSVEETLGVFRADRVRERPITWLWPGYLPTGKLVILEGDPGDGKSVMTIDLAARMTTGSPMPDGERIDQSCDVIMISAEDDPEDTIRPRLRVAGADLRRVHMVTAGTVPDSPFDLRRDMPALELLVNQVKAGMIVIDPLMAFMPSDVDAYKDSEVRRALHPLTRMAMRTGCAVVVVRHLVKGRTKAITAGGGSIAFIGAARVGYLIAPHPEDRDKRVLSAVKSNIGPLPPALAYSVIPCPTGEDLPVLVWDEKPLDMTAQQLLDGDQASDEQDMREEARAWLTEYLSAHHDGEKWPTILRAAKAEGYGDQLMRRARKGLAEPRRNPTDRSGQTKQGTYWFLIPVGERGRHLRVVEPEPDDAPSAAIATPRAQPSQSPDLGPGPCDVCGSEPAVIWAAQGVRRCGAHNPMTYGGT